MHSRYAKFLPYEDAAGSPIGSFAHSDLAGAIRFCSVRSADPQHLGGAFAIAAHVIESELDVSLLEFREWLARLERSTPSWPDDGRDTGQGLRRTQGKEVPAGSTPRLP
jgi:hypothetical protein